MKKALNFIIACLITLCLVVPSSFAGNVKNLVKTPAIKDAKRVSFKTSSEKNTLEDGHALVKRTFILRYCRPLCRQCKACIRGRLDIKPFSAGELVPANQTFDSVSMGSVQMAHGSPLYWKGKKRSICCIRIGTIRP